MVLSCEIHHLSVVSEKRTQKDLWLIFSSNFTFWHWIFVNFILVFHVSPNHKILSTTDSHALKLRIFEHWTLLGWYYEPNPILHTIWMDRSPVYICIYYRLTLFGGKKKFFRVFTTLYCHPCHQTVIVIGVDVDEIIKYGDGEAGPDKVAKTIYLLGTFMED